MSDRMRAGAGCIIMLPRVGKEEKLSALSELRAYWGALAPQPGIVPPRLAVQPRAIEGALAAAFLAERVGPGQVRLRIAGRNLVEALGREPRNLPLSTLMTVEAKLEAADLIEQVFAEPAVVELDLGCEGARARLLLMPLTDYLGQVTMMLGGFAMESGEAPGAPGRFRLAGRQVTRLPGVSVTQPGCFALEGIRAAAEAPAPFRGAPPGLVHSRED